MNAHYDNIPGQIAEAVFPGRKVRRLTIHLEVGALSTVEAEIYCGDELRTVAELLRPKLTEAELEAVRFFSLIDGPHNVPVANRRAATLRGLLDRLR